MKQAPETPEAKGENEGLSSAGMACAACGLPLNEWKENNGKGVKKDNVLYCSSACAAKGGIAPNLYPASTGSGNP